ncbi:MAG TPA: hypothetical protein ACHBX0_00040 [Arsenophonus sp.]
MAIGELSINHLWQILRKEMSTAVLIAITLGTAGILRTSFMNISWDICIVSQSGADLYYSLVSDCLLCHSSIT